MNLRMIGLALAAAFWVGQANAEELTGTLKKIKETGAITIGFRDSSIPFSYLDDRSALRLTSVTRSSMP
jgi:glutamate/aspartate transport system substrate-binding protein